MIVTSDNTLGAVLIGTIIASILYGMTNLQTYYYYMKYPNDGLCLKALVFAVWMLDTVHVALISRVTYYYAVSNLGKPIDIMNADWSFPTSELVNLLITALVQCYFAVQIFDLCNEGIRWLVTGTIAILVAGHLAYGILFVALWITKNDLDISDINLEVIMPSALFSVLSGVSIVVALSLLLYGSRLKLSRTIFSTFMVYAINRCILPTIATIIFVIAFSHASGTLWYTPFSLSICKLWANSLLSTLNGRKFIKAVETARPLNITVTEQQTKTADNPYPMMFESSSSPRSRNSSQVHLRDPLSNLTNKGMINGSDKWSVVYE